MMYVSKMYVNYLSDLYYLYYQILENPNQLIITLTALGWQLMGCENSAHSNLIQIVASLMPIP